MLKAKTMLFLILIMSCVLSAAITSEPPINAYAQRSDHPYEYAPVSDQSSPNWQLLEGPTGMVIDAATGRLGWHPTMEQSYRNTVSISDGDATQTFEVFVLGLNSATQAFCKALNDAFNAAGSGEYYEYVNQQLVMHLGDSQSMAQQFGMNQAMSLHTSNSGAHNPRIYGFYIGYNDSTWVCSRGVNCSRPSPSDGPVDQNTCNGGQDGGMRATGHDSKWGNLSSQKMSWGLANVESGWNYHCNGGPAIATVHYGHNDGAAGVSAAAYTSDLRDIVDFLISKNTIPVLITTPTTVVGGGWGSAGALALYPEYGDSVIAVGKEYNIPVIDFASAVWSALRTVPGLVIDDMLADDVHYKSVLSEYYDGDSPLHNPKYAGNIIGHQINHLIGYLLDTETKSRPPAWAKFTDNYRPTDYNTQIVYEFPQAMDTMDVTLTEASGLSFASIRSSFPTTNYQDGWGSQDGDGYHVEYTPGSESELSIAKFDLSSLRSDGTVLSAELQFHQIRGNSGTSINLHQFTASMTPTAVNWNSIPAYSSSVTQSVTICGSGDVPCDVTADLTAWVKDWHDGTTTNNGFILKLPSSGQNVDLVFNTVQLVLKVGVPEGTLDVDNVILADKTGMGLSVSPNPANPSTKINFSVDQKLSSNISLNVYDIKGSLVKSLVSGNSAGKSSVTWNGLNNDGKMVSSGIYLIRLSAGDKSKSVRFILSK